jgi:hypothetical protein
MVVILVVTRSASYSAVETENGALGYVSENMPLPALSRRGGISANVIWGKGLKRTNVKWKMSRKKGRKRKDKGEKLK